MSRHLLVRFRLLSRRIRRFIVHKILHADDPPHRLALGVAIGMFMTFTPTVGVQSILVALTAWVLRANKLVGMPMVWISNPATIVPIYYFCYVIGHTILGSEGVEDGWWQRLAYPPQGWWNFVGFYWMNLMEIALPLWVGALVVGLCTAVPTYYLVYFLVRWYRIRRWGRLVPSVRKLPVL